MQITDVKIRKFFQQGRLRAVVSVTLDNMVVLHDLKLIQGDERLFVAMPARKDEEGKFRDIIHPINGAAREMLESSIVRVYNAQMGGQHNE